MKPGFIHDCFRRTAERFGDRIAIEGAKSSITYGELEARSNGLANRLRDAGAPRGAMVAILAEDPAAVITAILATLKGGYIFVPLDARIPERRIRAMVEEVSAEWFLTDPGFSATIAALAGNGSAPPRIVIIDQPGATGASVPDVRREPDEACYVYFTSGSTGRPKGIVGRLKAIDHFVRWEIKTLGLEPGVRVSQLISPSFDAFLRDAFTPLCAGGTVCVPDSPDAKLDASKLTDWIDRRQIALVHTVPSLFRTWLPLVEEPGGARRFSALRHVLLSGEPLLPLDVKRWTDVFGERIELVNLYGPSETTMTKFVHRVKASDQSRPSIPIGVPMDGASAIVVDAAGKPCPKGIVGEIYIRTAFRSLGYYRLEEQTNEVFIPNPFGRDARDLVYKTGDLGRVLEDGVFELRGRQDHQVKIRGERVELGAIENVLRAHPGVDDVAVVDRQDASGTVFLVGYIVGNDVSASNLREFLAKELAPSMVPSFFVPMDALPRTVSGKLDRSALPPPDQDREAVSAALEPARTPVEAALSGMFTEVLGLARVGIGENFFELGGHSLLATQLISRVRHAFGVDLPVRSIFEAPTVAAIAERVEMLRWAATTPTAAASGAQEFEL